MGYSEGSGDSDGIVQDGLVSSDESEMAYFKGKTDKEIDDEFEKALAEFNKEDKKDKL